MKTPQFGQPVHPMASSEASLAAVQKSSKASLASNCKTKEMWGNHAACLYYNDAMMEWSTLSAASPHVGLNGNGVIGTERQQKHSSSFVDSRADL